MKIISQRTLVTLAFIVCVGLMTGALYFQHILGLEPCPLCIMQRVVVIALGMLFLVMALHNPASWGRKVYGALTLLLSLVGIGVAVRHVWLQHLPADQVPACGPGLDYMLDNFPMKKTLELVFRGSGECAEIGWTFLGFSIPEWLLVAFSGFVMMGVYLILAKTGSPSNMLTADVARAPDSASEPDDKTPA